MVGQSKGCYLNVGDEVYDRTTRRRISSYIDPTSKRGNKMKRKKTKM